jgi:hypothetical protein
LWRASPCVSKDASFTVVKFVSKEQWDTLPDAIDDLLFFFLRLEVLLVSSAVIAEANPDNEKASCFFFWRLGFVPEESAVIVEAFERAALRLGTSDGTASTSMLEDLEGYDLRRKDLGLSGAFAGL